MPRIWSWFWTPRNLFWACWAYVGHCCSHLGSTSPNNWRTGLGQLPQERGYGIDLQMHLPSMLNVEIGSSRVLSHILIPLPKKKVIQVGLGGHWGTLADSLGAPLSARLPNSSPNKKGHSGTFGRSLGHPCRPGWGGVGWGRAGKAG